MFKLKSWPVGIVMLTAVIALMFGGIYLFVQSDAAQSLNLGRPGRDFDGDRPVFDAGDASRISDNGSETFEGRPAAGDFGGRREGGHNANLQAGLAITLENLVKIGLVVGVVGMALPALNTRLRRRKASVSSTAETQSTV